MFHQMIILMLGVLASQMNLSRLINPCGIDPERHSALLKNNFPKIKLSINRKKNELIKEQPDEN
jgi:hypothetical protein